MHHGSTPAAWTAVIVALVGLTIGGVGLIPEPNWLIFWIGVGVTLAAGIIGPVMSAAGCGAKRAEADHH